MYRSLSLIVAFLLLLSKARLQELESQSQRDEVARTVNYDFTLTCTAETVFYPTSTKEVSHIIKHAVHDARKGVEISVRVSRPLFHSSNAFPCPRNTTPEINDRSSIQIVLTNMSSVLNVNTKKRQLIVGAGMLFSDLMKVLRSYGYSLTLGTLPTYNALSVGGLVATASHGTHATGKALFADNVVSVTFVNGQGQIRTTRDLTYITGALGMTGIITELRIQALPESKARTTQLITSDTDLPATLPADLARSPILYYLWRPDYSGIIRLYYEEIAADTPGDAGWSWHANRPQDNELLRNLTFITQADVFRTNFNKTSDPICQLFQRSTFALISANSSWSRLEAAETVLVGNSDAVFSGGCVNEDPALCIWSFFKIVVREIVLDLDTLPAFMEDVKAIAAKLPGCLPNGEGLTIRFGPASHQLLAPQYGRASAFIELGALQLAQLPLPMRFQEFYEEVEQLALCKYGARVHWGKSAYRMLTSRCALRDKYPMWDQFNVKRKQVDPFGLFKPELFDVIDQKQGHRFYPGCALRYDCYCEEDIHCQLRGDVRFRCVPGSVFPEYKVCRAVPPVFQPPVLP